MLHYEIYFSCFDGLEVTSVSDRGFYESHAFLRLLLDELAASSDFFSWSRSAHTCYSDRNFHKFPVFLRQLHQNEGQATKSQVQQINHYVVKYVLLLYFVCRNWKKLFIKVSNLFMYAFFKLFASIIKLSNFYKKKKLIVFFDLHPHGII